VLTSRRPAALARRMVIVRLRNLVALLGRTPTLAEIQHHVPPGWWGIGRMFARHRTQVARGYQRALRLAGATPRHIGYPGQIRAHEDSPAVLRQLLRLDAALASQEAVALVGLTRRCPCGGIIRSGIDHQCRYTA
jgi:hypothetical protein